MSVLPGLDQIKELGALTEQCAAQARIAKQQAQKFAAHFKANAHTSRYETTRRRTEDPVTQARRHVVEAEARVARQESLVAKLSSKNPQLAGQAKEILRMLQQTLCLARDHLEIELRK